MVKSSQQINNGHDDQNSNINDNIHSQIVNTTNKIDDNITKKKKPSMNHEFKKTFKTFYFESNKEELIVPEKHEKISYCIYGTNSNNTPRYKGYLKLKKKCHHETNWYSKNVG